MKISKKRSLNILMLIFLSLLILILSNFINHNLYTLGFVSLFSYLVFYKTWWNHYKVRLNFYTIFLTFTLVFYWGQFILLLLNIPLETGRNILDNRIPLNILIETGILILNSMVLLHLGVIFSTLRINRYNSIALSDAITYNSKNEKKNDALKKVAYIMLGISIIPSFYLLLVRLSIVMTQGYGAIFQSEIYITGGFNNIPSFLAAFTMPSFLALFITCKKDKSLKYIKVIFVVYLSMYFLAGSRMSGIMMLSIMLLVKHFWYGGIGRKELLTKYSIIFVIGVLLMSSISEVREIVYTQGSIGQSFLESIKNIIYNNPIFSILRETGFIFITTAVVFANTPYNIPFNYGASYINSILMIFPNLFWDVHPAAASNTDIVFNGFYTQYGGIGSSFIAEAYWNFGYFSILFVFVFGVGIGFLTTKMAKYSQYKNANKFFLVAYTSQVILTYVRSDTISFWRNFTYYGLVPIIAAWLLGHFYNYSSVHKINKSDKKYKDCL